MAVVLYTLLLIIFDLLARFFHFFLAFFGSIALFISVGANLLILIGIFLTIGLLIPLTLQLPSLSGENNFLRLNDLEKFAEGFTPRKKQIIGVLVSLISITGLYAFSFLIVKRMGESILAGLRFTNVPMPLVDSSLQPRTSLAPFVESVSFTLKYFDVGLTVYWVGRFFRKWLLGKDF